MLVVPDDSRLNLSRNRAGVDALALDPQDDSKVYVALGEYTNRSVDAWWVVGVAYK